MSAIHFPITEPLKQSKFLLLGIATGLVTLHLHLAWHSESTDLFTTSLLFWSTVCFGVWKKYHTLSFKTGLFSSLCGTLLITFVLLRSLSPSVTFPCVFPALSALGVGLLASGWQGLKQYRSQLLCLSFLGFYHVIITWSVFDISELTARFAAFILWYLGFDISRQGVNLILPTGSATVYLGCSGLKNILDLLGIGILLLTLFPTRWQQKILVPIVAISIGFVVNGLRVALMTVLSASNHQSAFEYWHQGDGSLIFALVAILLFWLICRFGLQLEASATDNSLTVKN